MKTALSLLLAFILPSAGWATDTVIRAGTLIDTKAGTTLSDRYILIEDGTITDVLSEEEYTRRAVSATMIDLSDMTVLPGLSDAHVHLTSDATLHGYRRLTRSTPRAAITGVRNAKRTLEAGFTTVRNVGAPDFTDVALRDAITDGDIIGPQVIPAGRAIGITGGHCDNNLLPYEYGAVGGGVADGPWEVRGKVRENKKYGAEVIKFCGTGGVLSKGTTIGAQQFTLEEMEAIVDEAHQLGMKATVHAHGERGINSAIRAGVDSVEHASLISDEGIRLALENGTVLSMDIYVSDYILSEGEAAGILPASLEKERQVGKAQRERFQAAVRAGVPIAFGSDAGVYKHGLNGRQFAYMVQWGQTPMQAIQSATVINAELFNLDGRIGVIAPGADADIIAVDQNPLQNVRALEDVDFVMADGAVIVGRGSKPN
ncbi:amidohydrolase family protein [uncultured Algimonas sp.]|uniref:Xaa-Pro dipeptidase n=1 Tax=uncultured Algimonas sp. TaxID=1547920 RepID=UPI00260F9E35|nr:amidohydrolase family protein [uncultured Algimonas sp.]